eukprot:13817014-Alexandrium_andersonii.AAC.1
MSASLVGSEMCIRDRRQVEEPASSRGQRTGAGSQTTSAELAATSPAGRLWRMRVRGPAGA